MILIPDTKAAADEYKWQINFERRKRQPHKRGRPKILVADLDVELKLKEEMVDNMEKSLQALKKRTKNQMISESDLEECDDLLSTDDENENETVALQNETNDNPLPEGMYFSN